jgi:dTDP-4-dehydrorhamnose 3,5-epimerase
MDHAKLVYCSGGVIWDVILDLRVGSPTYAQYASLELTAESGNMCYIPSGFAHGFCVLSEQATVHYKTTSLYSPQHDQGVRWDSAGIEWPCNSPVLSERDQQLVTLAEFQSPFHYD